MHEKYQYNRLDATPGKKNYIFGVSVKNHIIKVSFCFKFQKAVKPKRAEHSYITTAYSDNIEVEVNRRKVRNIEGI